MQKIQGQYFVTTDKHGWTRIIFLVLHLSRQFFYPC